MAQSANDDLAPLVELAARATYEDGSARADDAGETPELLGGRVELEKTGGERRAPQVPRCGARAKPLGIDPAPPRWAGKRKTAVQAVHGRTATPQASPAAA